MGMRQATVLALGVCLYACGSAAPVGPAASSAPVSIDVTWSDPPEYRIERATEGEGEAIFERTGIGDPYRTGLPYPIFLALRNASTSLRQSRREFREQGRCRRRLSRRLQPRRSIAARLRWQPSRQALAAAC
jgi:hypothetical protein